MAINLHFNDLLREMKNLGASDLHLKADRQPMYRINGELERLGKRRFTNDELNELKMQVLNRDQKRELRLKQTIDLSYSEPNIGRFRLNFFQQKGTLAIVARIIPLQIPTIKDLELPDVLYELTTQQQGLVLVTGPTGSGKSTTLAAMIDHINKHRKVHILTIEDPIEFIFQDRLANVNQREVGLDTPNFSQALRALLRQDPDVIMVGEMRDLETIKTVLSAAETGHLVFSTLHTNDAVQSVERIVASFPKSTRPLVLSQLSSVLSAVISQRLVNKKDGQGRIAAVEVLRNSPIVAKLIKDGEIGELLPKIEESVVFEKMQSLNQSLVALWANQAIDKDEALVHSPDKDGLLHLYYSQFYLEDKHSVRVEYDEFGEDTVEKRKIDARQTYASRLEELAELREKWAKIKDQTSMRLERVEKQERHQADEAGWLEKELANVEKNYHQTKQQYDKEIAKYESEIQDLDATIRNLKIQISKFTRLLQSSQSIGRSGFFRR